MTHTVTDIAELIRHHLVLSVDDDETAEPTCAGSCPRSRTWRPPRCGSPPSGSSATTAASASTPSSSTGWPPRFDDGDFYCADYWELIDAGT